MYMNIEAERARNGLTQENIAQQLNISRKTYVNWINGVSPIPSNILIKMSKMFKVSIDYLLEQKETARYNAPSQFQYNNRKDPKCRKTNNQN